MDKYGQVAVIAVNIYRERDASCPRMAWDEAAKNIFPHSVRLQRKGCPRSSFLGLCEEGYIKDIPPGDYCNSVQNKEYGLKALNYLRDDPTLILDSKSLWNRVINYGGKSHNSQMDVVIALWRHQLIVK